MSLHYLSFNQDATCFATGLSSGFRVYSSDPVAEKTRQSFPFAITRIQMLYRSNYLALVGRGEEANEQQVLLWDDLKQKVVVKLQFRQKVTRVCLRRDRLVIVLLSRVYVYTFSRQPQKLHVFDTCDNELGLAALCDASDCGLLVFPARGAGQLHWIDILNGNEAAAVANFNSNLTEGSNNVSPLPLFTTSAPILQCHEHALGHLAMSPNGRFVATASQHGTLIRIWQTVADSVTHRIVSITPRPLLELRRGSEPATIYSMAFSAVAPLLAVTSDTGTVHVFQLTDDKDGSGSSTTATSPPMSVQRRLDMTLQMTARRILPPYLSHQKSIAQATLPPETQTVAAFTADGQSLLVLTMDGSCYKFDVSTLSQASSKQPLQRTSFHRFIKLDEII